MGKKPFEQPKTDYNFLKGQVLGMIASEILMFLFVGGANKMESGSLRSDSNPGK